MDDPGRQRLSRLLARWEGAAPSQHDLALLDDIPHESWTAELRRRALALGVAPTDSDPAPGCCAFPLVAADGGASRRAHVEARVVERAEDDLGGIEGSGKAAAREALDAARAALGTRERFALRWSPPPERFGGSSFGLAVALAALSAARGQPLDPDFLATGKVDVRGRVRRVSAVAAKLELTQLPGSRLLAPPSPAWPSDRLVAVERLDQAWAHANAGTGRRRLESLARDHVRRWSRDLLQRAEHVVPRIAEALAQWKTRAMCVVGAAGTGKSTLLAAWIDPHGRDVPILVTGREVVHDDVSLGVGAALARTLDDTRLADQGFARCAMDPLHPLGQLRHERGLTLIFDGVDETGPRRGAFEEALRGWARDPALVGLRVLWTTRPDASRFGHDDEPDLTVHPLGHLTVGELAHAELLDGLPPGLRPLLGIPSLLAAWQRLGAPSDPAVGLDTLLEEIARHEAQRDGSSWWLCEQWVRASCRTGSVDLDRDAAERVAVAHDRRIGLSRPVPEALADVIRASGEFLEDREDDSYQVLPTWPTRAALFRELWFDPDRIPADHVEELTAVPCAAALEAESKRRGVSLIRMSVDVLDRRPDWLAGWLIACARAPTSFEEALETLRSALEDRDPEEVVQHVASALEGALHALEAASAPSEPQNDIFPTMFLGEGLERAIAPFCALLETRTDIEAILRIWLGAAAAGQMPLPPFEPHLPTSDPDEIIDTLRWLSLLDADEFVEPDDPDTDPVVERLVPEHRRWRGEEAVEGAMELVEDGLAIDPLLAWLQDRIVWLRHLAIYAFESATTLTPTHPEVAHEARATAVAHLIRAADLAAGLAIHHRSADDIARGNQLLGEIRGMRAYLRQLERDGTLSADTWEAYGDAGDDASYLAWSDEE